MPEESTTPDLVERMREVLEALRSGDFDALTSFCAPDAAYESVAMGATFEGVAAMREFVEDIQGAYEEYTDIDEARAAAERLAQERE